MAYADVFGVDFESGRHRRSPKAWIVGGGIGSLAAAAFMIRDRGIPGGNIIVLEAAKSPGGTPDSDGEAQAGYALRGGRMPAVNRHDCTSDLFRTIPSLGNVETSAFDDATAYDCAYQTHSLSRLIGRDGSIVPVSSMGFAMRERLQLRLASTGEAQIGSSRVSEWMSPDFFETGFWSIWSATLNFQMWHGAVEFKRHLHRFMREFADRDARRSDAYRLQPA